MGPYLQTSRPFKKLKMKDSKAGAILFRSGLNASETHLGSRKSRAEDEREEKSPKNLSRFLVLFSNGKEQQN